MLSGMTANQLNEYSTMFFKDITTRGSFDANFWSSVPQHLLDKTCKHIQLAFQGFLYEYKFEIAHSSSTHQSDHEALQAFKALRFPDQEIWKEMNKWGLRQGAKKSTCRAPKKCPWKHCKTP